jgi:methionyl-tRNA formyltransferase
MRIFIAGKNNIAVNVLEYIKNKYNFQISVVLNQTENYKNCFQKSLGFYAKLWNIPIVQLEDTYQYEDALFLSLEYDKIINPIKFNTDKLYNIHFSYLPSYKGMYTSALPILHGKKTTGVTLHQIDMGIDTGNIIKQTKIKIKTSDTSRDLYLKYINTGTEILISNFDNLLKGNYSSIKQSTKKSTYFGKHTIDYHNLSINYNKTAIQIINQLRAFSFREYQLPKYKNKKIIKWKITRIKSTTKPGTILKKIKNGLQIATIDYNINIWFDSFEEICNSCKTNNYDHLSNILNNDNLTIDIETKTNEGWTALMIAAYHGSFECVEILIKNNANVNASNYNGTNVLMYAKSNYLKTNNLDIINLLLKNNIIIDKKDIFGKTVIDWVKNQDRFLYNYLSKNNND